MHYFMHHHIQEMPGGLGAVGDVTCSKFPTLPRAESKYTLHIQEMKNESSKDFQGCMDGREGVRELTKEASS